MARKNRPKNKQPPRNNTGAEQKSKYARKKAKQMTGERPRFGQKEVGDNPEYMYGSTRTVRTTVAWTAFQKGFLFLKTDDGQKVFLGLNLLQRSYNGEGVQVGDVINCEIEPHPNGKGPRVKRIISVDFASRASS